MPILNITADSGDMHIWGNGASFAVAGATAQGIQGLDLDKLTVGAFANGTPTFYVYRPFFKFNTNLSQLKGANINSLKLSLTCIDDYTSSNDIDVQIIEQDWSALDPITANPDMETAYDACLAETNYVLWRNSAGISTNTPYLSEALTISYLNTLGYTYYSVRSSRDKSNLAPPTSGSDRLNFGSTRHATAAYRQLLVIDYTPSSSQGVAFISDYGIL